MTNEPDLPSLAGDTPSLVGVPRLRFTLFEHDDGTHTGVELSIFVCANPDCSCTSLTLEGSAFSRRRGEGAVAMDPALRLSHDVSTQTTRGFPRGRTASEVGMIEALKKTLRLKKVKKDLQQAFSDARARLEPVADPAYDFSEHHDGTMAYYFAVYPDAEPVYLDVDGVRFSIDDAWCVRPGCACVEGVVALCTETERDDDARTVLVTPVCALRLPEGDAAESPARVTPGMRAAVLSERMQQTLSRHRTRIRAEAAERWGVERTPPTATATTAPSRTLTTKAPATAPATSSGKVGRNDPCVCGSGKKFKRCCLKGG